MKKMVLVMTKVRKTLPNLLANIKRYNHSPKGQATRKKWLNRHKEEMTQYNRAYQKNLRDRLRASGICQTCHKQPARPLRTLCQTCKEKADYRNKKR